MTVSRRLLSRLAAATAVLLAAGAFSASPARAADPLIATTFTATLTGTQITATLTAADGSVPAGVPVYYSLQPAGDVGVTRVNAGVTDANGQVSVNAGYQDVGYTYWYDTPGDDHYAASTSNTVHISAPVTARLSIYSDIHGATALGTVRSIVHGFAKPGMTVQLYAGTPGQTAPIGSAVTDALGDWSVALPPVTTPTTFQAAVLGDSENTGSLSNLASVKVSTKTTIGVAVSGGKVTVRGAVLNGLGTGQPGVRIRVLVGLTSMRDLGAVTTDRYGHYSYTATACTTACRYEAIAEEDSIRLTSWAISGTVKAPSQLALTAQPGRPDHLTITLTYAANHARIANQMVTVYYHYAGRTTWTRQTVLTTNRYGQASVSEQPRRLCYFTTRYAGTTAIAAAASPNVYLSY